MSLLSNRSAMVLFHDDIGHRSQKVRIVIAEKGIACNLEVLNKEDLPKEILEINPDNKLVQQAKSLFEKNKDDDKAKNLTYLIHEQAIIASGAKLKDPSSFINRLNKLLSED